MRRERLILIGIACVLLVAFGRELRAWTEPPTLRMFDVGQGDGILLSSRGRQILVDGGPDGEILSRIGGAMPFFDRTIDLLVLSHPHMDHVQSFPELARRYRIGAVLMTGVDYANPRYEEFLELLADEHARVVVADPDDDLVVGDLSVDVLWPPPRSFGVPRKNVNDDSVALRVTVPSGKTVLFTGDMEKGEEAAILRAGTDVRADVLKVAHHGSRTSSSTGFLLAVNPSLALASVAAENSYGLPDEDVIARYAALGIPLRMTKDEGDIRVPLE
jgi:competence protein ComEC